jgi:dipeptidyl aminopeptidase/acylaminoacyl peptidase
MAYRSYRRLVSLFLLTTASASASAATAVLTGPPPRSITDPGSITSVSAPEAKPVAVADLFSMHNGVGAAWARDGKEIVISANLTGRFNLWSLSTDGAAPVQLTQSDDRQSGMAVSPDGATVVFQSDYGGNEIYDLFAVPLKGGPVTRLTDTADVTEFGAVFSPDGKVIAFNRRPQKASSTDIAVMDVATRKVTVLTHEATLDHLWSVVGFTGDGHTLIANHRNAGYSESAIWRINITTGKAEDLTEEAPHANYMASDVTWDGKSIALVTDTAEGRVQAAVLDPASHTIKLVKPDVWDQSSGHFSPDGRTLVFGSNVDGRKELFAATGGATKRIALPPGVNTEEGADGSSFSPNGKSLLVSHQSGNEPFEYWTVDLATQHAAPVTQLAAGSIAPALLPRAQIVHYESQDGTVISAMLWVPFNLPRDGRAPGVVVPHGGPGAQTIDNFNRTALALASRGYVVIAPNPRGSSGYGRAFLKANYMDLGGGDLTDEVYGAKFMTATGYVDAKKIGITGGSYGGYMTLMAISKTPTLWAAGVEQYGIVNWLTMYDKSGTYMQQMQITLMGDPVKDKASYEASSPLTYIKATMAPLLVLQGENDTRVPKEEALQVVDLLKGGNHVVDIHIYPHEGHGFTKIENQIDALERTVAWFDKYLKGGA